LKQNTITERAQPAVAKTTRKEDNLSENSDDDDPTWVTAKDTKELGKDGAWTGIDSSIQEVEGESDELIEPKSAFN